MVANRKIDDHHYTVDEYFEMELESEDKHEYIDGKIYMMSGVQEEHDIIDENVRASLRPHMRKQGCRTYSSNIRVRISDIRYTYPDLSVVCGNSKFEHRKGVDVLTNPTLIIEILSASTETYDRGKKFEFYKKIETLQEYVLISQDQPRIERFLRQPNDEWLYTDAAGLDTSLELRSIGCTLVLAEVYADISFDDDEPTQPQSG